MILSSRSKIQPGFALTQTGKTGKLWVGFTED
jgi:hypothetical protein